MKSYFEVEDFFEKRKNIGIKPGLERVELLLKAMQNPEKVLQAVHVAGTNGKGSTIEFLQNGLIASAYTVGVFTSPSFTGLCGHFLIDGVEINQAEMVRLLNELLPAIEQLDRMDQHPTEYEILTVLGFIYFKHNVDIALIETAMGGTYDTTNCVLPLLSIITNVAMDHLDYLGNTLAEITSHKAGIIKQNCPVVIGEVEEVSEVIIREKADQLDAEMFLFGKDYRLSANRTVQIFEKEIVLDLHMQGIHQMKNAAVALMALEQLEKQSFTIKWDAAIQAINMTKLVGRFELVHQSPTIILDSAHNVAGVEAFLRTVDKEYANKEKYMLFAAFKDKQIAGMLAQLTSELTEIHCTSFDHPRAASLDMLAKHLPVDACVKVNNWQEEITDIVAKQASEKVYFITGSLHFITLVRKFIANKRIN